MIKKSEVKVIRIKLYNLRDNSRLMCTRDFLIGNLNKFLPLFYPMEFISRLQVKEGINFTCLNLFKYCGDISQESMEKLMEFISVFPIKDVVLYNMIRRDKIKVRFVRVF